ncbi:MAG: bifunctional riboflavin kinase/FAD synthetase [Clostridia bacterium]|nr:bifunctional riboflavin kinase/FAD synthetase [Clostridia bacterium]
MAPEKNGMRGTCVALGNFDGIHLGHAHIISTCVAAAKEKGLLSLVWSFRRHPEHIMKGNFSTGNIISNSDKDEILRRMGVDLLFLEDFERVRHLSPEEFCEKILLGTLSAKALFCGFNFRFGKGGAGDARFLKKYMEERGVSVYVAPPVCVGGEPVSSTRIRALLTLGDMEGVKGLLGRNYSIRFPVLHGKRLGSRIGFPTLNQVFPEEYVTPKIGVYAVKVHVDGRAWRGVCNVGIRPTVEEDGCLLAETHICDFSGDLYGRLVTVEFLRYLREERKFEDLDELCRQIDRDRKEALALSEE